MEAKHTATPWKRNQYGNVLDTNGERVVLTGFSLNTGAFSEEAASNADFVFTACNSHDDLAKALRLAERKLTFLHNHYSGEEAKDIFATVEQMRAALAEAGA